MKYAYFYESLTYISQKPFVDFIINIYNLFVESVQLFRMLNCLRVGYTCKALYPVVNAITVQ